MRILFTLITLASLSLAHAQYVTDKVFFSGARLGICVDECYAYYFPHGAPTGLIGTRALGAIPLGAGTTSREAIADAGSAWHSGAPAGEVMVDFRSNSSPLGSRRVIVYYRESDRQVMYVCYWKMEGQAFSPEQILYLTDLNSGVGPIITHLDTDGEFEVTTAAQEKLEKLPNGR